MRYAAIASLVVCVGLARAHQGYLIGENRYCKEYHEHLQGVDPEFVSHHECEKKCDNLTSCQGFLMSCATECYLFGRKNCTTLVSSCFSYVAVKNHSNFRDSFLKDPWQDEQFIFAIVICIACTAMASCLFAVSMRPQLLIRDRSMDVASTVGDANLNRLAGRDIVPRPASLSPGVMARVQENTRNEQAFDTNEIQLEWAWRLIFVLGGSVILLIWLIVGMANFPNDGHHQRGICGLVHGDLSPYGWLDSFALWIPPWIRADNDHNLLVNGRKLPNLEELPERCAQVYGTDVVDEHTGPGCQDWCANITGNSFRFACSFPASDIAHVYTVCNKVLAWTMLSWLPPVFGPIVAAMIGALFGTVAYVHAKYSVVPFVEGKFTYRNVVKPSDVGCTVFPSKMHKLPLCMIRASSDAEIFRAQLWVALSGFVVDIAGDVNSSINFLLRGELAYSLGLLVMAFIPNLHNLFQSEGIAACLLSFNWGFPTRDVYVLQRREGATEGIFSLLLGIFILMRGAYFQSFENSLFTLFSISIVVATSVLSSLPHAGAASLVLQIEDCDFGNFERVESIRDKQYWMKFFPVLDGLALAVAFGRTFCSFWLAFSLWWIGILIGAIGIVINSVVERGSRTNSNPKTQWKLILAFVFWPFSPARLSVSRKFYVEMEQGSASIMLVCSRGCASLPPLAFYAHRWLTLIAFWIFTFVRPDRALYVDSFFGIEWTWTSETLHKLLLVFLFAIGWLALIFSMVFFCLFHKHLENAYWRSGDFIDQDYDAFIGNFDGAEEGVPLSMVEAEEVPFTNIEAKEIEPGGE